MKIGNTELRHGVALAPMAGYTDRAMRLVCHGAGAEYTVTEMVSAKAVVYNDRKTLTLSRIREDEGSVAIQIFGSEPDVMAEAARRLSSPEEGASPVAIDINMGCPVKKIFSNGEGSALMRDPKLIEKIVSAVADATHLPVTVKLRAGINEQSLNAVECAIAAESGGASAICIHGRTTSQMYGGSCNRKIIENVKRSLQIPLFANGDITNGDEAISMLRDTEADGIMIGRGAVGNPFIFAEILSRLDGIPYEIPGVRERINTSLYQLKVAIEDKGERSAVPEARKQIALYLKAFHGAARIRSRINMATTYGEVEEALLQAADEAEAERDQNIIL